MESARNHNEISGFYLIKSLIEGRYANLNNQLEYLDRIEKTLIFKATNNKESSTVLLNDDAIRLYLIEQSLPLITNETEYLLLTLPAIKEELKDTIKSFNSVYKAINVANQNKALFFANYLLEFENTKSSIKNANQKKANGHILNQIGTAFHDLPFYKYLTKLIEPLLHSSDLKIFRKIFRIYDGRKKISDGTEFSIRLRTKWEIIKTEIDDKIKNKFIPSEQLNTVKHIHTEIKQKSDESVKFYKNVDQNNEEETYKKIKNDTDYFFSIKEHLKYLDTLPTKQITNNIDLNKNSIEIEKIFKIKSTQVAKLLQQWKDKFETTINLFKQAKDGITINEILDEINRAQQILEKEIAPAVCTLLENWPKNLPKEITKKQDIENLYKELSDDYQNYLSKMGALKDQLENLKTKHQQLIEINNAKAKQEFLKLMQERREKLSANLKLFRDKKAMERDLRIAQKKEESKAKIEAERPSSPELQRYQNIEMHEILCNLKDKKLQFIKDILENKSKIYYKDVVKLIVKHLRGKVVEIGNGSSHERFLIRKHIIELPVSASEAEIAKHSKATGGCLDPHNSNFDSGILSPCNVELIRKTFIAAGITMEEIKKIEAKREEETISKHIVRMPN